MYRNNINVSIYERAFWYLQTYISTYIYACKVMCMHSSICSLDKNEKRSKLKFIKCLCVWKWSCKFNYKGEMVAMHTSLFIDLAVWFEIEIYSMTKNGHISNSNTF